MKRFQDKQAYKKLLYSPITIVALLVICILMISAAISMYHKNREAVGNKNRALAEYNDLSNKEANLESGISELETPEGIDENLREKYRVGKEGERLVVITDENGTKKIAEVQAAQNANTSFWTKVKSFFTNIF